MILFLHKIDFSCVRKKEEDYEDDFSRIPAQLVREKESSSGSIICMI